MASSSRSRGALCVTLLLVGLATLVDGAWAGEDSASRGASDLSEQRKAKTEGPQDQQVPATDKPEVRKESGVELPKESELRERVQARWDAVIEGKLDEAYAFETPEYRKAHNEQEYREEFGRQVRWHLATLKDLRYDRADEVDAVVTLDYSFALPASSQMARTSADITERWVYSAGQWWRRHARHRLGGRPRPQPSPPQ